MKITRAFGGALALATLLASSLTACGGSDDTGTTSTDTSTGAAVAVDDLSSGAYVVTLGGTDSLTVGKYHAAADGSRLLVLVDSDDHASRLYRRASASAAWVAVPAAAGAAPVTLSRHDAVAADTLTLAGVAGTYRVAITSRLSADFTVTAEGAITEGTSSCKLTGRLSTSPLPGALALTLATSGCGTLPATVSGALLVDAAYAPTAFRLVGDGSDQVVDLWAYRD